MVFDKIIIIYVERRGLPLNGQNVRQDVDVIADRTIRDRGRV